VAEHALGVRSGALQIDAQGRQAGQDDADPWLTRALDGAKGREKGRQRIALTGAVVGQQMRLVVEQKRAGPIGVG